MKISELSEVLGRMEKETIRKPNPNKRKEKRFIGTSAAVSWASAFDKLGCMLFGSNEPDEIIVSKPSVERISEIMNEVNKKK